MIKKIVGNQDPHDQLSKETLNERSDRALLRKTLINWVSQPITNLQLFRDFINKNQDIRRWYVARIFSADEENPYIDLYYAPPTTEGRSKLQELDTQKIQLLDEDNLDWWEAEEFNRGVHIPVTEFKQFLIDTSNFSEEQPIEEGMVFIEKWNDEKPTFTPFSFQARRTSREIYRKLLEKAKEPDNETGESNSD